MNEDMLFQCSILQCAACASFEASCKVLRAYLSNPLTTGAVQVRAFPSSNSQSKSLDSCKTSSRCTLRCSRCTSTGSPCTSHSFKDLDKLANLKHIALSQLKSAEKADQPLLEVTEASGRSAFQFLVKLTSVELGGHTLAPHP